MARSLLCLNNISQGLPLNCKVHAPASLWANVVERASLFGAPLPIKEQRIVLATLACHIHDLMVDRVKKYKHSMDGTTSDTVSDDTPATSILRKQNQFATVWWICTSLHD